MKLLIVLANIFVLLISFAVLQHTQWALIFSLSFSVLLPAVLNYWLVPGGFAWRNHQKQYSSKLKGPIGFPLVGNLFDVMCSVAHRRLASLAASCGAVRLMALSFGTTRVIISSHPETAKEILSGSSFSDRPVKESARFLMFERAIGFAPSGDYWRHLRRIAANHMFSPKRILCLETTRIHIADKMLVEVSEEVQQKGFVELKGILQKYSLKNVIESVFGNGLNLEVEEQLGSMVREGYELIGKFNWEDHYPLGFMDFGGVKRRCHKVAMQVKDVVGHIVAERRSHGDYCGKSDFLSALLSLPEEDTLDDSDMFAVLWEMIFRGTDTVAILLEWIMARIVLHPEIQAKAQLELDSCLGGNRKVRDSDLPGLPYLQSIVKEVLRLHPPGPLLSWARLAIHDVSIDKILIPAGTTAMVNMWAITHDPSIWNDPWTFRPERFMEEDVSIMGSDLRLAPFGSGRRVCPGKALGLATVHLWLARLLQEYNWLPAEPVDLSECLNLSLEMKKPVTCYAILRQSIHV
uniref:Cytochrome P450 n=2 Tax=Kalanchoe fedtschenkoi TaxID=63787 RepID=A0A7N0VK35_KALFE